MGRYMNLLALKYHNASGVGHVEGVSSHATTDADLEAAIRGALRYGHLVFVLLYHDDDVKVGRVVRRMTQDGSIRGARLEQVTVKVRLVLVARDAAGEQRLAELPPLPAPAFTSKFLTKQPKM